MFSWHHIPFLRLLLPFILGIFVAIYCPVNVYIPIVCIIFIVVALFLFYKKTSINTAFVYQTSIGLCITLLVFIFGYLHAYLFNETKQPHHFSAIKQAKIYEVTIADAVIEKEKFYRCYATVSSCKDSNNKYHTTQGTLLLYIKKNAVENKPDIGNKYLIKANAQNILEPANPYEFNYKQYLTYHNIYYQQYTDSAHTVKLPSENKTIYSWAIGVRNSCLEIIKKYIPQQKEGGVAEALLLGYKDDLDIGITQAFSRTGTLHVLAVSGLHAGIIFWILGLITRRLERSKKGKIIQLVIVIFGIWFYAFITGLSSSVLRASIMFSVMANGKSLKYNTNIYNNIYASAFILLVYNPLFIVDVGFQLSYLAVLGIVFIQPLIKNWWIPNTWLGKKIWAIISISLAAQLLTFPIGIFYFHQFPNYFLLSNLLIIPLTSIILIGLIVLIPLSFIPFLATYLGKILWAIIWFNNWLVTAIDRFPYSFINGIHFNFLEMVILYVFMLSFLAFCIHKYKALITLSVLSLLVFGIYFSFTRIEQNKQRIIVFHAIKKHDVITCLQGRKAYIISDSSFLADEYAIKFYLEPYFWAYGINEIVKLNDTKKYVETNIFIKPKQGFQFFDKKMTNIFNYNYGKIENRYLLIKNDSKINFNEINYLQKNILYSLKISNYKKMKFQKQVKSIFKKTFENNDKAIVISF